MKKSLMLVLLIGGLSLGGCTVSKYERTVTINRDPSGNITSVTEVEHMTQSGKRKKLPTRFLYDQEIINTPKAAPAGE